MNLARSVFVTLAIAGLSGCVTSQKPATQSPPVNAAPQNFSTHFQGLDGCFMLYDMKKNELVALFNKKACKKRQPACSTFKVPLSIMAFDTGVLKDETSGFKWDGEPRIIADWNKDHDATTWLRDSVVWFSQKITPLVGRAKIQSYLRAFNFGNQDFSGGLEDAWLTSTPFSKKKIRTTVLISAFDQIDFIKNLWSYQLPVTKRSMELTRKIIPAETSAAGYTLAGKTGSGFLGRHGQQRLGWYVAHLEGHEQEYAVVVVFDDLRASDTNLLAGRQAKEIMKSILSERGIW